MTETKKSPERLRFDSLVETIQQHPTEVLETERHLTAVKWFDYRFISPKKANRLFTKCYQEIYSRKYAQAVDVERADKVRGVHVLTMKDNIRERSQLVAARQRADELGISYPVYIEAAFDFAIKRGGKRERFPRPNQLHGSEKSSPWFAAFLLEQWNQQLPRALARVEHPSYLIKNYREIPAQDDFRRFILQYVKDVSMPLHYAIRTFAYERQQVPAELFRSVATDEVFQQAMEIVESDLKHIPLEPVVTAYSPKTDRMPTCFGMHYTLDLSSPECASCPQVRGCKFLGDLVLAEATTQAGVDDPAGDYKKRKNRERQQRCRAKKRKMNNTGVSTRPHASYLISP